MPDAPAQGQTPTVAKPYFGIRVVDTDSGRGVPLAQLKTVNELSFWTDNRGWIAFYEPDLMDREVFFHVASPGYDFPADGFGYKGVRLTPVAGESVTIRLRRTNIAQRMCRLTGEGLDRDSRLLGLVAPSDRPRGVTLGQDSVQAVPYGDKIFWLWGDTNLPFYPLGNFHTTAATSPLPKGDEDSPADGIPFDYFIDAQTGRVARMLNDSEPGAVWLFGLLTVADPSGEEQLIAHYSRHLSLAEVAEHGLARFNRETQRFEKLRQLDLKETWRHPRGNAVRAESPDGDHFYFCEPFAITRVRADWNSVIDPAAYEALAWDESSGEYRWQRDEPPTSQSAERTLVESGKLSAEDARYACVNVASGRPIEIHRASIQWNEYLDKWILIGNQVGDAEAASRLGEVWFGAGDQITGPWHNVVQIATHPDFSFYNPRHHPFFDADGGRLVYFEGTFTRMFSGSVAIPRYEYNQLLYQLDLADPRLESALKGPRQ